MNENRLGCDQMLEQMDACVIQGATPELLQHLKECSACANELETRKQMRDRVKSAVHAAEVPAFLEARVRNRIQRKDNPWVWLTRAVPVAAVLLLCLGVAIAYQLGSLRLTPNSQNAYIASISNQVATLMRVGLKDHVHCAVFRKYPQNAPKLEDAAKSMAPEYRGLIPVVTEHVPADYRLMMAHQCRYQGRRFVHLTLMSDKNLVSVVIAKKEGGESFQTETLAPALAQSGIPFYQGNVQRFSIAAFESRDHLVYVVSDLPGQNNLQVMTAMAPGLREELHKLEL